MSSVTCWQLGIIYNLLIRAQKYIEMEKEFSMDVCWLLGLQFGDVSLNQFDNMEQKSFLAKYRECNDRPTLWRLFVI